MPKGLEFLSDKASCLAATWALGAGAPPGRERAAFTASLVPKAEAMEQGS